MYSFVIRRRASAQGCSRIALLDLM
jgi:hypothetical protein